MEGTTNIFGYNFIRDSSYEKLADEIIDGVTSNKLGLTNFITPNAHGINMYLKYKELNEFCQSSKYILPDGQPIVWLSRLTGKPIVKRLTGSDFFPVIYSKLRKKGLKSLFVVSNESLKEKFEEETPDDLYMVPEFFEMEDDKLIEKIGDRIFNEILRHNPGFVFIGISEPKQGALAMNVTKKLKAINYGKSCIFFFLGASFEFYFGMKKRAPSLFQNTGMEWFYRLITEPKRMYKRYIFGNALFVARALKWLMGKNKKN